jgi:hypothetical protein
MTGISFDINVGRVVLEGHFDLSLGRLHEVHLNNAQESSFLNNAQESSFYFIGHTLYLHYKGQSVGAV